ncbi:MAG: 1-acyl-sn-glycerol-3-phosphate acyltransferase [Actinomycetota bacterium]|nr:1-acyl-sn-glycerol-3-phosphate acyltransferase [Actinomycetota bacterium]
MSFLRLPGEADPTPEHAGPKGMDHGRRIGVALRILLYRNRIRGLENVPNAGPVLFVPNHTNFIDGPVLFGVLPRRVSFLVKSEAVKGALGWVLTNVGQYPLKRDVPDRTPLMAALGQLKAGGCIGIFPEGSRGEGKVANVFNGAGWLAVRSGATVVPVAIRGTDRPAGSGRRFRPLVNYLIGSPFDVPMGAGKKAVDAATAQIQHQLSTLVQRLDTELASRRRQMERPTRERD